MFTYADRYSMSVLYRARHSICVLIFDDLDFLLPDPYHHKRFFTLPLMHLRLFFRLVLCGIFLLLSCLFLYAFFEKTVSSGHPRGDFFFDDRTYASFPLSGSHTCLFWYTACFLSPLYDNAL